MCHVDFPESFPALGYLPQATPGACHCPTTPGHPGGAKPTGHVHLGTVRTALHNFLAARASGGTFLLRIDDTDTARNDDAHVTLIHDSLTQLDLVPDRVFHQSSQASQHQAAAGVLKGAGWAVMDGDALRLSPQARALAPPQFFDLAAGVCPLTDTLLNHADNLVLLRSDGSPTYHFASIVDDIDSGVNFILRGADHLSNVAKQVIVAQALARSGYPGAQAWVDSVLFAHVGLLLKDGKKLSKRDGASSVQHYFDQGVPTGALLQWVLTLGWGHPDSQFNRTWPIIGMGDMPGVFAQGGLRAVNCGLDANHLATLVKRWKGIGRKGP
jgi:glutamyl-tRNA synthetase